MNLMPTFRAIVQDKDLHARWLNSLSYLEYRGFRKIARSQSTEDMTLEVLLHASEEVRHALFFKRLAIKVGGSPFNSYQESLLLGGPAVKAYFYELDGGAHTFLQSLPSEKLKSAVYCIVTWLVEERAMSLYRQYEEVLREGPSDFSLLSILREEKNHLEEMVAASEKIFSAFGFSSAPLRALEEKCFQAAWTAITRATTPLRLATTSDLRI